ncbi:hypothetical protein BJM58_13710 [Listeria monocytogenes]|uniref:hypothetical protein n=1 Tax=Listeria monocytogenes TaxID=1639 RepID=UPI000873E41A|nr:hypothetical protein [Listeria monocytogenes]OFG33918.1 hypothetical protein BJM58_13710 [Listeria monocytogenes]
MNLHVYHLGHGLFPLDWEFCFLTIDEYKEKLEQKYNPRQNVVSELETSFSLIDEMLLYAKNDFKEMFSGYDRLRCPPMIFPIPKGDSTNEATFCIILKRDEDGDTVIYSPVQLSYLEK